MKHVIAVLATLDTKGAEAAYLKQRIEAHGDTALLIDMGVVGAPGTAADVARAEVAARGGKSLEQLLRAPTRQEASPVMVRGATAVLQERLAAGGVHAVIGLGGTQGTSNGTAVMRALPYGFPKLMVSTVASGDVSAFVDIKDVTMMFSVGDILGLNPVLRKMLANAAGAACGMADAGVELERRRGDKPLIGLTNLGVLTDGTLHAVELFEAAGYEVIVFHAVGSGGRAMEQMMKEGLIGAVFDYALGEITDELFHGLRAASAERLTVAGKLGLPQVICPGGAEHVGLLVEPDQVPAAYRGHQVTFHNPIILAPRLKGHELARVGAEVGKRLTSTSGRAAFFMPMGGTSRYGVPGGELHDAEGDAVFRDALRAHMPESVEWIERAEHAEHPDFVRAAVEKLIALIEG